MQIRTITLGFLAVAALLAAPMASASAQQAQAGRERAAPARPAERLASTTSLRNELRAELAQRRGAAPAAPAAQQVNERR